MGIFNIKVKTKNGNDIGKKVTFTVFLRIKHKKNLLTKRIEAMYTYKIMYGDHKTYDPKKALKLKNENIKSFEDFTLKVFLNMAHIIASISKKENLEPDFILFMTPDLAEKGNRSWTFVRDVFMKPGDAVIKQSPFNVDSLADILDSSGSMKATGFKEQPTMSDEEFRDIYTEKYCKKMEIERDEIFMFKTFRDLNPNTTFMLIDPQRNAVKYSKSIAICNQLKERFEGEQLQITEKSEK